MKKFKNHTYSYKLNKLKNMYVMISYGKINHSPEKLELRSGDDQERGEFPPFKLGIEFFRRRLLKI